MRIRAYFGLPLIATRPPINLSFGTVYRSRPMITNCLAKLSRSYKDSTVFPLAIDVASSSGNVKRIFVADDVVEICHTEPVGFTPPLFCLDYTCQ